MDKLIQLIQAMHADARSVAWLALGGVLFAGIVLGIVALFWILAGGTGVRSTQALLAQQREIARWLRGGS